MSRASDKLTDVIRGLIKAELAKEDSTAVCRVERKRKDGHYDVSLLSNPGESFRTVPNGAFADDLEEGDYAYLYKIKNNSANSFIIAAIKPYAPARAAIQRGASSRYRPTTSSSMGYSVIGTSETAPQCADDSGLLGYTTM